MTQRSVGGGVLSEADECEVVVWLRWDLVLCDWRVAVLSEQEFVLIDIFEKFRGRASNTMCLFGNTGDGGMWEEQ